MICIPMAELETNTPLVVDRHRILPLPLTLERMQPVAWRGFQIIQACCPVDVFQSADSPLNQICCVSVFAKVLIIAQ